MAGRQPPESRIRHSFPIRTPSQRSTSRLSNPNVFSDDFALEPLDSPTSPSISPVESNDSIPESSSPQASAARLITSNQPINDQPPSQPRNSTSKRTFSQRHGGAVAVPDRTQSTISRASMATSATQRTASTASRFSMPRPPSPYTGATGPSHPYQMYPQVTRASSTSTIRPPENAFVGAAGPEHPYAMYPQNTVPEEDTAEIIPASMIPVGFPGMGQRYQRHVGPQGEDVADIIGPDGHTEQLPPYTRYPDDMPRKYDAATAEIPVTSSSSGLTQDAPLSDMTTLNEPVEMGDANRASRTERGEPEAGTNNLRGIWRRNSKRRVCCGLPLWVVLGIIGLILLAATIGGVIGSIVGSENGNKHHHHHSSNNTSPLPDMGNSSAAASTTVVTATSWIDATPLPTSSVLPGIPVGDFSVPLYQVKSTSATCVVDPALSSSWGCMPPMSLDISVTQPDETSSMAQVSFEPYPLVPNFTYGAQPPDLGGNPFQLSAFLDKDDTDLGAALFFVTQYPKIIILPQNAIAAGTTSKRSISETEILRSRGYGHERNIAEPGDTPWFCFWNNTVLEFFIYVAQNISNSDGSSSNAATSATTAATSSSPTVASPTATAGSNSYRRMAAMYPQYPRYVKVQEKRKPYGNIPPYCQQMQVLYDGTWNPAPNVPIVSIQETEPSATAASSPTSTTAAKARRVRDVSDIVPSELEKRQNPLESLCYCQWLTT